MARSLRSGWAVAALVTALLGVGPGAQAQAPAPSGGCPSGVGIGLVDAAVTADPRSRSYVVDQVEAGQTFTRRLRVCNGTSSETSLELYPGAAVVEDGEFRVVEGRADNELTEWISLDRERVTVPAGGSALVTARVAVPEGVDDGERYGVVLAALPVAPGAPGVGVVQRVGVRVYLAVGRSVTTDFSVTQLQAVRDPGGRPVLEALVRNTGRRALDPRGTLVLSDGPGGTSAGPFPVAVGTTIGPGQQAPVRVPLDPALTAGPWQAELALAAGGLERRVTGRVTWPAAGAATPVPATSLDGHGWTVVVATGLPVLLLLALLLLLLARRRRRRDGADAPAAAARPAAVGPADGSGPVRPAQGLPAGAGLQDATSPAALASLASPVLPPHPVRPAQGLPAGAGLQDATTLDGRLPRPRAGDAAPTMTRPPTPSLTLPPTLPAPRSAAVRRALAARRAASSTPEPAAPAPRS